MRRRLATLLSALALVALTHPASAELRVTIDKEAQRMSVAVDGETRHVWPVSTGLARYDTPNGAYRPFRMEKTHFSREWDNAPMPHAIFFTPAGHAIHATHQTRHLGRPASHGCVRLSPRNAATLFALVRQQGMGGTRVTVEGSIHAPVANLRRSEAQRVARSSERARRVVSQSARDRAWEQENYYDAPVARVSRNPLDERSGYGTVVVYDDGY
ncbi:L,D-transpeptidase [Methylobacterium sp. SD274]|uniref:L,D-transpeptidase n=1 Tax=Methylobacterium sp. SD274 TaxID=2782009 RepID=UPI001A969EB8|nr:L,D-transpeptidase [Methylobacterium sp. SD274]MBO1019890.1 L,D-transpeptidase [Methylobacterium sp. SD274]